MEAETRDRMQRAHALIKQKKYGSAYNLIQDINHPTAIKWRTKLESLINNEFGDPFAETEAVPQSRSTVHGPQLADALAIFLQNDWQVVNHMVDSATVEKKHRSVWTSMALVFFFGLIGLLIVLFGVKATKERITLIKKDDGTLRMTSKGGYVHVQNLHTVDQMAQSITNDPSIVPLLLFMLVSYIFWGVFSAFL